MTTAADSLAAAEVRAIRHRRLADQSRAPALRRPRQQRDPRGLGIHLPDWRLSVAALSKPRASQC
jgi:hypothetical protein